MSILEQIQADTTTALKAGDRARAQALRLIRSELQKAEKEGGSVDEITVLQRERKRRVEAADAFRDAGRQDLAESEESEAGLIEQYLPDQLSDDELESLVADALAETGATQPQDMGKVMAALMPKIAGRADGKRVSGAVKGRLTG
jgi:uncharacterized protein YqeY